MNRRASAARVEITADDPTLTPHAGLLPMAELVRRLGLVRQLDGAVDAVRPFKQRRRGVSGGELLVTLAEAICVGADHVAHLEELRSDAAGAALRSVAEVPASSTAAQLLGRLRVGQCHAALAAMAEAGNRLDRELGVDITAPVTLDMDPTDIEVHGQKEGAGWNHHGLYGHRSHLVSWAERRRVLTTELTEASANAKRVAPRLLRRALKLLPTEHGQVRLRADTEFYSLELMRTCRRKGVRFALSVPRHQAMWQARLRIPEKQWRPALEMKDAEVAEISYRPGEWEHEPLRLIVRRVRVDVERLSQDVRARRRRTVPAEQLKLAMDGRVEYVYSYSFFLTDMEGSAVELERWQRQRAHIEERIKDLKLGCGLNHLPLASKWGNWGWLVANVIAHNLVSMLATLLADTGHRANCGTATLRRWLFDVPGRVLRSGRRLHLRLAKGLLWATQFQALYRRTRALPLLA